MYGFSPNFRLISLVSVFFAAILIVFSVAAQSLGAENLGAGDLGVEDLGLKKDEAKSRQFFGKLHPFARQDLPAGRFKQRLDELPDPTRRRAMKWLHRFNFSERDLPFLEVDRDGGIFFVDPIDFSGLEPQDDIVALPQALSKSKTFSLHSKPGAANMVYLDMDGHTVTGTAWNGAGDPLNMRPYDSSGNDNDFTGTELKEIAEVWKRVAEDFAPFDIDVTTEEPAAFGPNVGHILVTRKADRAGKVIYNCNCGGVAYVDVWGGSNYSFYQPALVFLDGVTGPHNISEAASHELGHNLGLSHDGTSDQSFYLGHGTGKTSWAPIMGAGYRVDVSQWSKGEYADANNAQDDIAIIKSRLRFSADDHEDSAFGLATPLKVATDGRVKATTPVSDPANNKPHNKGIIENRQDVDLFSFYVGRGTIDLTVTPGWIKNYAPGIHRGMNLDVAIRLYNARGVLVAEKNPSSDTNARIKKQVAGGAFILAVEGAGNKNGQGYSDYGSLGHYFINGRLPPAPDLTLNDVVIKGPRRLQESGAANYRATALWDDGSSSNLVAVWSADSALVAVDGVGNLQAQTVTSDEVVTLSASVTFDGVVHNLETKITLLNRVAGDFDGDSDSDIFWHHQDDGRNRLWRMDGTVRKEVAFVPKGDVAFEIGGLGDLTGDGKSDILWHDPASGANRLWEMDGNKRLSSVDLPTFGGKDWIISGIADFTGDSKDDIFWHNIESGLNRIWEMNGGNRTAVGWLPPYASTDVELVALADFDGDGDVDILLRNQVTGANNIWFMDGRSLSGRRAIPRRKDLDWRVAGAGDFDGDGKADILWRNGVSGLNAVWLMNGADRKAKGRIPTRSNTAWTVVGTGDYDGSTTADILWRNDVTGSNQMWLMSGFTRMEKAGLPKYGDLKWQAQ